MEAVAEEGTIPEHLDNARLRERMQPLLQRLLAERFHLVIRREPKELPVYELTVAKSGAKPELSSVKLNAGLQAIVTESWEIVCRACAELP